MELATDVDVAVVGAGLSGLAAGLAAQEQGARVLVVEKAKEPGGSSALSGGYLWSFTSVEQYRSAVPRGDAELGRVVVEDFETAVEWLTSQGARFEPRIESFSPDDRTTKSEAAGHRFAPDPVSGGLLPVIRGLESGGGKLATETRAHALVTNDAGDVVGLRTTSAAGGEEVKANAVVIATGGFQGNLEMMCRYVSPYADRFVVRAARSNTGNGLRIALDAGAAATRGLRAFYGHLMPAPPAEIEPGAFRRLSQFYSPHAILLNLSGRRFVDEGGGDPATTIALGRQYDAAGFLVFDSSCHREHVCRPYLHDALEGDPLAAVREVGGSVLQSESLEGLVDALGAWGVPLAPALRTLRGYDEAAAAGRPDQLEVQRTSALHRLATPPFYAVPVVPGATFTEGGILVNRECNVLDDDGRPIRGLFAAGADVGGVSYIGYAGGLSAALVTGLRAGVYAALEAARVS